MVSLLTFSAVADYEEEVMAAENATGIDLTSSPITWDDATWILTSAFIIFTMQSGKSNSVITNDVELLVYGTKLTTQKKPHKP